MAATKTNTSANKIPDGFVSPFKRVEMQPSIRIDDGLCCVAMLTGQPLDTITKLAHQLGLPEHGPAWVYASMLIKLLEHFDMAVYEKEASSIHALPYVALITARFNASTQYGQWVLWHHVKGTSEIPAFHYAIDPAYWIPEEQKITTDFNALLTPKQPIYYLEVAPRTPAKAKGK